MGTIRLGAIHSPRHRGGWPNLIRWIAMDLAFGERGVGARAGSICGTRHGRPASMHFGYVHLLSILWVGFLPKRNLDGVSKLRLTSNVTHTFCWSRSLNLVSACFSAFFSAVLSSRSNLSLLISWGVVIVRRGWTVSFDFLMAATPATD